MKKIFLAFVLGLVILGMLTMTVSGALYEYYDYSGASYDKIYQAVWFAQTFTVGQVGRNVNQTTTSISIRMEKQNNPGAFGLRVTETSGNVPDITKTLSYSKYSASLFGALQYYNLSFTVSLKPFVRYALVFNTTSTVSTDSYKIRMGTSTYAGGNIYRSVDNGSTWIANTGSDCGFYIYGFETNISADYLYEYQDKVGDSNAKVFGTQWTCQTFKTGYTGANESFNLARVTLGLKRSGAMTGQCWVHLRPTNSTGYPIVNTSYAHGIYDSASITNLNFVWVNFVMNTSYTIQRGTKYAITFNATGGSAAIYIAHQIKTTGGYGGGNYVRLFNNGSNQTFYSAQDSTFNTYGYFAGAFNVVISNVSPVDGSTAYVYRNLADFVTYYNYTTPSRYFNLSFLKTCQQGKNTTTTVYFDGTLVYTSTWINGSRTLNILPTYTSLVSGTTYTWNVSSTYLGSRITFQYNVKFKIMCSYEDTDYLYLAGIDFSEPFLLLSILFALFYFWWRSETIAMTFIFAMLLIPYIIVVGIVYLLPLYITDAYILTFVQIIFLLLAVSVGGYTLDLRSKSRKAMGKVD
jgi:hypothetical protein